MTKVSDFPDGYDVPAFIEDCKAIWHRNLETGSKIPAVKNIGGIPHRLYAWTEVDDVKLIEKDLEVIKRFTKARHIASLKMHKKYQCVYIA